MLVGHFSKAMPVWLEMLFDIQKPPCQLLNAVAQKSKDFMVDPDDCTAEPCLLVRLAKRTLLLCLAVIAILILTGVVNWQIMMLALAEMVERIKLASL